MLVSRSCSNGISPDSVTMVGIEDGINFDGPAAMSMEVNRNFSVRFNFDGLAVANGIKL